MTKPLLQISKAGATTSSNDIVPKFSIAVSHESQAAGVTLHVENIYGDNSHHIIESCFKGLARTLRTALEIDHRTKNVIPSTKGSL